tara:strand:- start:142 stop:969 length:828 start_codon:yes stop_codon:yes gene_type:complete
MNKLICVGQPFNHEQSSCSDLTPELFEWSVDVDQSDTVVCIDNAIVHLFENEDIPEKRFAWLCESPVIAQSTYDAVSEYSDALLEYYTAIFTCDKELSEKDDRIHLISSGSNLPWVKDKQIYTKTKNVSLMASDKNYTEGHRLRHTLAESHRDEVDVLGSINGDRIGSGLFDKLVGYQDYRFTVVIENCKHNNYYTEKITDAFATGTIPVYWGSDSVFETFNPDGILELTDDFDFSQLTEDLYQEKIGAVNDNFERVNNLKMVDDELYEIIQTYN